MSENIDILIELGEACYGPRWQTGVARALKVSDRSVRDWVARKNPVKDGVIYDLIAHAQKRCDDLQQTTIQAMLVMKRKIEQLLKPL